MNRPVLSTVLLVLLTTLYSWKTLTTPIPPDQMWDRKYYLAMAEGDVSQVMSPLSKRVLHPAAAATIAKLTGRDVSTTFFYLTFFSLAVLTVAIARGLAQHTTHLRFALVPLLLTPYLVQIFSDYFMHDLFYAALLACFFLMLFSSRAWLAVPMLGLLFVTREATMLLSLILLVVYVMKRRYRYAAAVGVMTLVSMLISSHFGHQGLSNRHHLGELLYMVFKIAYNSARNLFGVNLWVDTFHPCTPVFHIALPSWIPAGAIQRIGFCAWNPWQPVETALSYLTIFGVGPLIGYVVLRRMGTEFFHRHCAALLACFLFGVFSYVLGPLLGPGGYRLMGYGWPAFWLAMPMIMTYYFRFTPRDLLFLLSIHMGLSWTTHWLTLIQWPFHLQYVLALALTLIGYRIAWTLLQRSYIRVVHQLP